MATSRVHTSQSQGHGFEFHYVLRFLLLLLFLFIIIHVFFGKEPSLFVPVKANWRSVPGFAKTLKHNHLLHVWHRNFSKINLQCAMAIRINFPSENKSTKIQSFHPSECKEEETSDGNSLTPRGDFFRKFMDLWAFCSCCFMLDVNGHFRRLRIRLNLQRSLRSVNYVTSKKFFSKFQPGLQNGWLE